MSEFIIDEDFDYFYNDKGFGPPIFSEHVSEDILKKYQGKLPNQLLEYWKAFGFSGWGNGLFWLVNPEDYQDVLDAWLENIDLPPHEELIYAELSGDFPLGDSRQPTYKSLRPFDLVS